VNVPNDTWFAGRQAVLATMHKKESVIAPLLARTLGITLTVPERFDTDRFGTFTREIPRLSDQRTTAIAKATAALNATGADLALASEGSFSAHPTLPFLPSNLELIVLLDRRHNLEIVGHYRTSSVQARGQSVTTPEEATAVAEAWGFPDQGIIVRRTEHDTRTLYKDMSTSSELAAISRKLLRGLFTRSIHLETDMRAHRCPARRESITQATLHLIEQCQHHCPRCDTPGFVVTDVVRGLPCHQCQLPTDRPRELVRTCQHCAYHTVTPPEGPAAADPSACAHCNP